MTSKIVTEPDNVALNSALFAEQELTASLLRRSIKSELTVEKLKQGIFNFLQGDYPSPCTDECPHDKYDWEVCTVCDDVYFSKLLEDVK